MNITANGTGILTTTAVHGQWANLFVTGSFGGGTLTISILKARSSDALMTIDTLTAASSGTYAVGAQVEVHYTLAGATSPDIVVVATEG